MKTLIVKTGIGIWMACTLAAAGYAQSGRSNSRLKNMQKNIERIEARIAAAEEKMLIGDSLITQGDRQIAEADKDFFRIADEVKTMNKTYRRERKRLYKLTKSKDRDVALKARTDLHEFEKKHREQMRAYNFEARDMRKKALQGDNDIRRGQQMQAMAAHSLRDLEKTLRDARERYDLALSTLGK